MFGHWREWFRKELDYTNGVLIETRGHLISEQEALINALRRIEALEVHAASLEARLAEIERWRAPIGTLLIP